jgi:hypothetical protein
MIENLRVKKYPATAYQVADCFKERRSVTEKLMKGYS